jgi:hypothetical protein
MFGMAKVSKYADALEELEALHRSGQISDARYELHRQKLLGEATQRRFPLSVRVLLFVLIVVAALVLLRAIGSSL